MAVRFPDRSRCGVRGALALLLAFALVRADAQQWQLPDLMRALRLNQRHEATFVERRYLKVLDQPLESAGELLFVPPARIEKRTLRPRRETLVVDGDELYVDQEGRRRLRVNLQSNPEAAAFVDSIRGTLAGDLAALERAYSVALSGTSAHWRLALAPRAREMARIVSGIRIAGSDGEIATIDFDFTGGDRSEMVVTPVPAR